MTITTPLPGLPSPPQPATREITPPTVHQWRIHTLQMVNWGGFEGHHLVNLNANATLLTGASGTGKSTLMDAYIALMMNSKVPFNGASNDNVSGRARSAEQRNPLSYVRGKVNTSRDDDGRVHDQTLRGQGTSTWSGLALTWVNGDGSLFTALRLYFAPASATSSTDLKVHMATYPGLLSLADVEEFAQTSPAFQHTRMSNRFPGLAFHEYYSTFGQELHKRLGIGRGGDGASALRLLARIQAGRQVASVDGLFRDMVLEEPRTYDAAGKAIDHFGLLEASYETMRTAEDQVRVLHRIPQAHDDLLRAEREVDLIDTFRVTGPIDGASPFRLWMLRTKYAKIDTEVADVRRALGEAQVEHDKQEALAAELAGEIVANRQAQADNGGDALERIEADLTRLAREHDRVSTAKERLTRAVAPLDVDLDSAAAFTSAQQDAQVFLDGYDTTRAVLRAQGTEKSVALHTAIAALKGLEDERQYLTGRDNLIPQDLDRDRNRIAEQVGIDPSDLPFVAELVDLSPDHEQWREAAELVLGGFGRTLLVDRRIIGQFRSRMDALRLRKRLWHRPVDLNRPEQPRDPATLAGRLVLKDSPAAGWLSAELARAYDHVCVPDASQFRDDRTRRVTLAGQVQEGDRGAHGGHGGRFILGFSNQYRMSQIEREIVDAAATERDLRGEVEQVVTLERALDRDRDAHRAIVDARWSDIDTAATADAVTSKESERDALLATSNTLATLKTQGEALVKAQTKAVGDQALADAACKKFTADWDALVDEQDFTSRALDDLEQNHDVALSQAQSDRLDAEYVSADVSGRYADFNRVIEQVRKTLATRVTAARREAGQHRDTLITAFETFQEKWFRPNLGTDLLSYPAYEVILNDLNEQGLAQRRDKFTAKVIEWSGEDLLGLVQAYDDALDDIRQRLEPVNTVLAGLPFGPNKDRLRLTMEVRKDEVLRTFQKNLRTLASHVTLDTDPSVIESRFESLRQFIARIRPVTPGATERSQRDHLLDVRRHVHIEAVQVDATTGARLGIYDTLGGKSGGETQELIAFIVGAALRYRLGDDALPRPAYAPVFLDEGFVKSDSEFAGRAVNAWLGLGFQLIIGAPLDKVTAIQPYMNQMMMVTKNDLGRARLRPVIPKAGTLRNGPRP